MNKVTELTTSKADELAKRNQQLEEWFARMGTIRAASKPLGLEGMGKSFSADELVGIALAYAANWFSDDEHKFNKVLNFVEFIVSNAHATHKDSKDNNHE